jgi:PAS domain S-box-containing protein
MTFPIVSLIIYGHHCYYCQLLVANPFLGETILAVKILIIVQLFIIFLLFFVINNLTISRLKKNRALGESELKYSTLLECSNDSIIVINQDSGMIMEANGKAQVLLGRSPDELIKMYFKEIYPREEHEFISKNFQGALLGNHPWGEFHVVCKDGRKVPVEINSGGIVLLEDQKLHYWVLHDITERKLAESAANGFKKAQEALNENELMIKQQNEEYIAVNEELLLSNQRVQQINMELIIAKDKAEESDRLKSAFLANMSHEIKTPMNGIISFSDLLLNQDLSDEKKTQYIQLIHQSGCQLFHIISDIVDFSKAEAGQVEVNFSTTNINRIMLDTETLFTIQALEKKITLSASTALPDADSQIITDETRLRQILHNLMSNAIKFTDMGSVNFGYVQRNTYLEFYVRDTGIGIAEEHHQHIFERFRQVASPASDKSGTGLGLSISKVLVELLGGKLWVKSEPGRGATFYFTIPFRPVGAKQNRNKNSDIRKKYNWSQKTILVVEDDDTNFLCIDEILSVTYTNVIRASNGADAIKICTTRPDINLVLMDLKLPVVDGFMATRKIKQVRPQLPVIAQTAYSSSEDKAKALNAGCDDYITKPLNKNDLLRKIETQFNSSVIST